MHGCVSALAVREALVGVPEGGFAIVLTDRPVDDLGDSLVARFRRQRVEPLDSWTTVPGMFAGRHLDAGLRHAMPWLPELLFEWMPPGGYPPSATELVTRDHILGSLDRGGPGRARQPTSGWAACWSGWATSGSAQSWAGLSEPRLEASIAAWVGERAGPAAAAVLRSGRSPTTAHVHVLALGLMLDVLYGGSGAEPPTWSRPAAAGRPATGCRGSARRRPARSVRRRGAGCACWPTPTRPPATRCGATPPRRSPSPGSPAGSSTRPATPTGTGPG